MKNPVLRIIVSIVICLLGLVALAASFLLFTFLIRYHPNETFCVVVGIFAVFLFVVIVMMVADTLKPKDW